MGLVFKNNAKTTLSSGVNDSTTTIPVTEGSVFPAANLASSGTYFFVTLDDDTNNEIVKVTVSSGSAGNQNLTVVRAQESTSARAFSSGNKVELRMTAGVVDTFNLTAADITLDASNDRLGFGDTSPEVSLDLGAKTDALHAPVGTTAQRPGSPEAGYLRYNSTTGKFEGYTNAWGDLADGSDFLVTNSFTTANNSTTAFTISNAVQDEKQLLVFIDGVFQAHNSYSVSGTTVTLSTAPASGREVTIYSALSNLQGANMVIATMTGDNSDTTLDLGVTPVSENNVQVYFDGVYQNKDSFSISGQVLTFGVAPPTGVAVEAITHTVLDISAAASSVLIDEFTGDGSDTTFSLSAAPANENNTQVYVGGVYQEKATYSVSGTTLTFSEAPANNVSIEVMSIAVGQINSAIQLSDADGDTKVQVEESSDEDKIRFDTAGSERVIIDNAGKVGIGESTPLGNLHVKSGESSGSADANADELVIEGAGNHGIQFLGPNNSFMQFLFGDNDDSDVGYLAYDHTNNALSLGVNGAERMRIDSSGLVGIGTTSPSAPLTVSTTGSGDAVIIESTEAGSSNAPDLVLHRNSASPADDDSLGIIRFRGENDASQAIDLINIFGQVTDVSDGSEDSTLYFKTYKDGAEQSPLTLAGGDVLIGNTFPSGNYTDASMTPSLRLGNGVNIGIAFNRLNISTSASAVFDTSNISNDGQSASGGDGLYMFTLVRTGGSYGTRFVGILGVDDSVCAIVETLENQNFTVTTSGTVLSAALSYSGSAVSCVATLQPLAIGE